MTELRFAVSPFYCLFMPASLGVASPFQTAVEDGQRDLVDPAVKGTLNVLAACKAAGTVERVVLTSSIAAVKDSSNEVRRRLYQS